LQICTINIIKIFLLLLKRNVCKALFTLFISTLKVNLIWLNVKYCCLEKYFISLLAFLAAYDMNVRRRRHRTTILREKQIHERTQKNVFFLFFSDDSLYRQRAIYSKAPLIRVLQSHQLGCCSSQYSGLHNRRIHVNPTLKGTVSRDGFDF
jgi:hypothetical protein